jgi:protein-tyrosine kinase
MNTIEKALQKQQQKLADEQNNEAMSSTPENTALPAEEPQSSIEKAAARPTLDKSPEVKTQPTVEDDSDDATDLPNVQGHSQYIELDLALLEAKGFVSTNEQRQLINEEFRAIKRKVLENAFGPLSSSLNNSNIIMVTSSNPGEGKTFTAINLALSIALEKNKTVLLVDADVLRPNVMRTLECTNQQGLMEYLLGEKSDISEVMYKTSLPKLRIIPAGKSHHLSTELLASEKMYEAVEEFANRYTDRVVIVDTPPLLGINETAVLANLAGQAVVVTEEGKTRLVDIQNAVAQLNPEMAIGFIVNKAQKVSGATGGYGYYYASAN